jgi:mycothiol system anti-sigma-R factor
MDCKRASEAIYLFFDNQMEAEQLASLREHVALCAACARHLDLIQKLLLVVRERCERQSAPVSLRLRILSSLPHRCGIISRH